MYRKDSMEYAKNISEILDDKINTITSIQYHYDLENLTSCLLDLSDKEEENVLEQLINDKLMAIMKSNNAKEYRKINKLVDEVTEFFYKDNKDDGTIFEEGSCVASDLVLKVIGSNGRKINLPIKISFIKEYCISNIIEEKDIRKTLLWIALELSVINYFLNKDNLFK